MWQLQAVLRIGLLVCVIRRTHSCYVIVEKGKTAEFSCTFPNYSTLITWQALTGNNTLNLATCNMATRVCASQQPSVYQGRILSSLPGNYTMGLNIKSARINETRFRCLADGGVITEECQLEVYVMPSTVSCSKTLFINQNVTVTCTTNNIYPSIAAYLYRREPYDFNASYSSCDVFLDGSASCTWRVPFSNLLDFNTFYVNMFALVGNDTQVGRPAVSSDITVSFSVPKVVFYDTDCPVGPGVIGGYIKVGTLATCKCQLKTVESVTSRVRWYTKDGAVVGTEDPSGRFSTLTLDFNASNVDSPYDCRAENPSLSYYHVLYTPKFTFPDCHVIVEIGQSTHLECPVQGSVNTFTWQVWTSGKYENVTTCPLAGACVNHMSPIYTGRFLNSSGVPKFTLDINSARSNETQFRCLTDNRNVAKICTLEPYRWPSTPTRGGTTLTNQYVEVTFSTVAYPYVQAILHRRRTDMSNGDFDSRYCSHTSSSSDPYSDYLIACTWRIPFDKLLLSNKFYAEMSLLLTNQTLVNRSPVVSNDTSVDIGAVRVSLNKCPEVIRKGTSATCICTSSSSGISITAQARWFTADEKAVGVVDSSDGSSTLTVSFDSSDPNPTYLCRGINPTREYPFITYQPTFSSSVPVCATTWMLFLLAVCTGLSSTLF